MYLKNVNVKGVVEFPNNYEMKYTNGVFGASTPKGELSINFYLETPQIPKETNIYVNEKGRSEKEEFITQAEDGVIVKYVQSGLVMNLETAKSIYEWLGVTISLMEGQKVE